jgi:hypothetical protein
MSSAFDSMMQADAAVLLGSSGEFAEEVTYAKRSGVTRSIYAIVDRQPPARVGPDGMVSKATAYIDVQNSATTGIALSELQSGDSITYNVHQGVAATARKVNVRLLSNGPNHDAAVLRLEV